MAGKSNGLGESEWARAPPPSGPLKDRIAKIFYDPSDGSILGRTPKRWGIALLFYAVFYAVLALLFTLCMGGLFMTLDDNKPAFILESSLIGVNPGLAFRPAPADGVTVKLVDNKTSEYYVNRLRDFLAPYVNDPWFASKTGCKEEDNYGYPNSPCFFIKLNKIYGWKPELYDVGSLPSDMSNDLVEYIKSLQPPEREQIWISCWMESPESGTMEYPWGAGLPARFYPYVNEDGYRGPVLPLRVTPNVRNATIAIRCRAWAKNIIYNKSLKEPSGYTRILLQVDEADAPADK